MGTISPIGNGSNLSITPSTPTTPQLPLHLNLNQQQQQQQQQQTITNCDTKTNGNGGTISGLRTPGTPAPSQQYPPNHPLSGSKHLCAICEDRASGKHYGVYRLAF